MHTKRQKISLLLSLIINILLVGEFIYSEMFRTTTKALILFIPFGIITCILFLWNFCKKNPNHKPIHIAKYYFLWGFILFFQIIFILILEIQIASQPYQSDETPLWTYPVALNIRYKKQTGYYFPPKIPKTAKNITYTEYYPNEFTLAFNIDKNYIDNEIKKLKPKRTVTTSANGNAVCKDYSKDLEICESTEYIFLNSPSQNNCFKFSSLNNNISTMKYYILEDDFQHGIRGIATNKDRIIYFYFK